MKTIILIAALFLLTWPAKAQVVIPLPTRCAPTPKPIVDGLASKYGEKQVWSGISASGLLIVLLANPKDGTWTLLSSKATGNTCMELAGENSKIVILGDDS